MEAIPEVSYKEFSNIVFTKKPYVNSTEPPLTGLQNLEKLKGRDHGPPSCSHIYESLNYQQISIILFGQPILYYVLVLIY